MEILKFTDHQKVNEEFIGAMVKGALGKLFNLFNNAFKDLANDFKTGFKEDDPTTIKDIIIKNFDQAVDGAQKEITGLKSDGDILSIMDNMVTSLTGLANGLSKDVEGALTKEKAKPVEQIAKAILLGSKEADFVGIVGALDPLAGVLKKDINFKFSKKNYVTEVNKGKDLNAKKALASKFFDNLQKEIKNEIEKGITDEEVKNLYGKLSGTPDVEYKIGDKVIYLLKGMTKDKYNEKLPPEQQNTVVGVKNIEKIDGDNIIFKSKEGKDIIKTKAEIIGKSEEKPTGEQAKKAQEVLGKIKDDEEKMSKVASFAEFIQNDANKAKIAEIEKLMGVEKSTEE